MIEYAVIELDAYEQGGEWRTDRKCKLSTTVFFDCIPTPQQVIWKLEEENIMLRYLMPAVQVDDFGNEGVIFDVYELDGGKPVWTLVKKK